MRFSMLPGFVLLLPLAEIAGFVSSGGRLACWPTLALVMLSFVVGMALLRRQGIGILRRMSAEGRNGVMPGRDLLRPAMNVIASLLLIIPGFLSGYHRHSDSHSGRARSCLATISANASSSWERPKGSSAVAQPDFRSRSKPKSKVVDLDEDDYHREPDRNSPWSGKQLGD